MASITKVPPEILVLVFEWTPSHKGLLNYALVCRSWSEWAIDVGWRTCKVPLSEVMKILHITRNPNVPSGDVNDATWDKFITVSSKVTRLKPNMILLPEAVAYFDRCRNQHINDVPFRNVRELIIHLNDTDFRTVSTACSGALVKSILVSRTLEYSGRENPDWIHDDPSAPSLAQPCPEVEEIYVNYVLEEDPPMLSPFTQLRVLICHVIVLDRDWWRDLANCSNLVELWLKETFTVTYEAAWPEDQVSVFRKLEEFHCISRSGWVLGLMTKSLFPSLRKLRVRPCPRPNQVERITPHLRQYSPYLRDFQLGAEYVAKE